MNQKPILIANWKMNLLPSEEAGLAKLFVKTFNKYSRQVDVVIAPSFVGLCQVGEIIRKSSIALCAQDLAQQKSGAYTGEISAEMLKDVGVKFNLVGHSERRLNLGETDSMINQKILTALVEGIIPILCVGETYEERTGSKKELRVTQQLTAALKNVSGELPVIIAYEPVWALSPHGPAESEEVKFMTELIHQTLVDLFPLELVLKNFRIIYGGSVEGNNINDFLKLKYIEGALVGAASLDLERFQAIIKFSKK